MKGGCRCADLPVRCWRPLYCSRGGPVEWRSGVCCDAPPSDWVRLFALSPLLFRLALSCLLRGGEVWWCVVVRGPLPHSVVHVVRVMDSSEWNWSRSSPLSLCLLSHHCWFGGVSL